jgi:hypothetical protein
VAASRRPLPAARLLLLPTQLTPPPALPPPTQTQEINAYKAPGLWLVPSFTRRREVLAGRLAILGFAAACAWEVINPSHPGPMAAASMLTGG